MLAVFCRDLALSLGLGLSRVNKLFDLTIIDVSEIQNQHVKFQLISLS